jgi:probable F420-dependent oxidoreductase
MTKRPIRFGLMVETHIDQRQWFALAHRAEELGYATFLVRDHISPDYFGPQFAPLVSLAALIGTTSKIGLGTLVIDNDFRHPAILAKEAATLDVLSGGRFELGIGAGWLRNEYERAGIPYDPNGVRIDRLQESLQILKACLSGSPVSFAGEHYQLDRHEHFPQPITPGGPKLMIGAGKPRMLKLAGRHADIVGLLTTSVSTGEVVSDPANRSTSAVRQQIELIREGAGPRFDQIELSIFPMIAHASNREDGLRGILTENGWTNKTLADVRDMAAVFAGTTDEIADQMIRCRDELGLSYFIIEDSQMEAMAPVVAAVSGL